MQEVKQIYPERKLNALHHKNCQGFDTSNMKLRRSFVHFWIVQVPKACRHTRPDVVDNSEGCLKWGGGSLKKSFQKHLEIRYL